MIGFFIKLFSNGKNDLRKPTDLYIWFYWIFWSKKCICIAIAIHIMLN